MIKFNRPYITGNEARYIQEVIASGHLCGDGTFTRKCSAWFRERYGFAHNYLTTSCTDALEMAAILAGIGPGDEVIVPSYTFVSTANAFVLRGAKVVFVDSLPEHPNVDPRAVEAAITPRTRAIVVVHYGGVACAMDELMDMATEHGIHVIEDAAQSVDAFYKGRPLGGIGTFSAFSFHETKNVVSGEGGLLVVNDDRFARRAEVIREKGTDRSAFFRGEVDKYGWVDIGSSFLASEITAAFLYAQLEDLAAIQHKRIAVWNRYQQGLQELASLGFGLPSIPEHATNNAHLFHLICPSLQVRTGLIAHLAAQGVKAVFHYQPLHRSPYRIAHDGPPASLPHAERFGDTLVRLPLFAGLSEADQAHVIAQVLDFAHRQAPRPMVLGAGSAGVR